MWSNSSLVSFFCMWLSNFPITIYCSGFILSAVCLENYSAIVKDEILPFETTRMDLKNIMLSEIIQMEKVKNHTFHSYVGYKTGGNK